MKNLFSIMISFFALGSAMGQNLSTGNPAFDAELTRLLPESVPFLSVGELREKMSDVVILDTREREEFEVSHIPGARFVGYKKLDLSSLDDLPKNQTIVLYCSVGYRSGKVGKKMQKEGFTQVFNLYGSIFEWANEGYPMENENGEATTEVHTYNEKWSQWVDNPKVKKVF